MSQKDVKELTNAFQYFNEAIRQIQDNRAEFQRKIDYLNQKLERKNLELERRIIEGENIKNFLNGILENIYTGVLVIDTSGNVTIFNKAAEEISGYQKEEVLGRGYRKLFEQGERNKSALYTMTTGTESYHRQKLLRTSGGEVKNIEFSTTIIRDVNENVMGVVEAFNDISELKKLQEKISHIQTLAALGEMAASVAHEIRNPLGGVQGHAELLARRIPEGDSLRKLLNPILEGVKRLNNIVSDLLTFTRPQRLNPQWVSLRETLEDALQLFRTNQRGQDVEFEIEINHSRHDPQVSIDVQMFEQIIINLLQNAVDAIEEDGRIEITTRVNVPESMSDILDPEEKDELMRLFSTVEIEIKDNGKGISSEKMPKLFHPFFTTKPNGNGLGLAISKKIVQMHKGDILVSSREDIGTTFTINLPLYETVDISEE